MKTFTRTEVKEVELRGVRVKERKEYNPIDGEYTVEDIYCINCSKDLKDLLLYDKEVRFCPYCGLDLIRNQVPQFSK